ncbi:MAG: hypothetical protein Q4A74_00230 [Cardiobacteriaceae bacterium]|nr:hypothetical protein [Cardiobacteriaceae bacterium]
MKGVLLKNGELTRVFDYIDDETIGYEFLTCGVDLNTYRWFVSGRSNYVYSPDGKIELREVTDDHLKDIVEKRISEVKKELYCLEEIKEDYSGGSD